MIATARDSANWAEQHDATVLFEAVSIAASSPAPNGCACSWMNCTRRGSGALLDPGKSHRGQ